MRHYFRTVTLTKRPEVFDFGLKARSSWACRGSAWARHLKLDVALGLAGVVGGAVFAFIVHGEAAGVAAATYGAVTLGAFVLVPPAAFLFSFARAPAGMMRSALVAFQDELLKANQRIAEVENRPASAAVAAPVRVPRSDPVF